MVQGGGMTLVKYILFVFNLLFVIFGITLIALGGVCLGQVNGKTIQTIFKEGAFETTLGSLVIASTIIIVMGVFIFILSFLGCCGAIKENYCMTMTYGVILFFIVILELSAGIVAIVFRDTIKTTATEEIKTALEKTLGGCMNQTDIKTGYCATFDDLQQSFHCCGVNGPKDWDQKHHFKECDKTGIEGCVEVLKGNFGYYSNIVGVTTLVFLFIEVVGVIFGCCLARSIKLQYEVV